MSHKQDEAEELLCAKMELDTILVNEIGQFGKYQMRTLALVTFGVIFSAIQAELYLFTGARINTRCFISECEDAASTEFAPSWILNAVPARDGSFASCERFGNASLLAAGARRGTCPAGLFDPSVTRGCEERVYEHTQTVVYNFDLGCAEWQRSIIGFAHILGMGIALPLTGYVSDRWGRRTALALNCVNSAWLGVTRYWITTYTGFLISDITETIFGAGIFTATYILVLELTGPRYRVIASGILLSYFALGGMILGLTARAVPHWRPLTLVLYLPSLITIGYFWFIPESIRWYMSKGRYEESEALLKEAARINRKQLSQKSLELLRITAEEEKKRSAVDQKEKLQEPWLIMLVFKHKQILIRCLVLPVLWIAMMLAYYGLSINAINMTGNQYVNYVAVSAVEIPGYWIAVLLLGRIGRKPVLMGAYWTCAACQFIYVFLPTDIYGVSLFVYLVGKCAISSVVTAIYVYTTELYPTKYRHNLFAFSSMVGRVGSIVAPLTPAIGASTFEEMPFVLFGSLALVSGFLLLLTPETLGTKLPDTMEEANNLEIDNNK